MKFYFAILVYASLGSFQAAIAKGDLSSEFTNSAALDEHCTGVWTGMQDQFFLQWKHKLLDGLALGFQPAEGK